MGEIKKRLPLQCPACNAPLRVGSFSVENAARKCAEILNCLCWHGFQIKSRQFILAFVKSSGSLKGMAKSMGVSYPTVRNILDDLIDRLLKWMSNGK
mgnify:CR=1 FL=1